MNIKVDAIEGIEPGNRLSRCNLEIELAISEEQLNDFLDTIAEYHGDEFILENILRQHGKGVFLELINKVAKKYE